MTGRTYGLGRRLLIALAALGLFLAQVAPLSAQTDAVAHDDPKVLWHRLQLHWEAVREDLLRAALQTVVTMFFIRWSTPPPPPTAQSAPPPVVTPPPTNQNTNPPPGDPPPPPSGQGDPPTTVDPPPSAPEPTALVIALVGAGLGAGYGLRRRFAISGRKEPRTR